MIDLLREKGVVECEVDGVKLRLGMEPVALPEAESPVAVKGKLGKDGLTKEQQLESYGRVIDAE